MPGMRADATHRFEFEVDGGRGSPFVCLARTRAEAERVALHAGGRVRLVGSTRLGPDEGDAEARRLLRDDGLFRSRWRDDIAPIVAVLDHMRHEPADVASIVPVALAPADELQARGLQPCECGRAHSGETGGLRAVVPPSRITVLMTEAGGWQAHAWMPEASLRVLEPDGWAACDGSHPEPVHSLHLRPATSVWLVAQCMLDALIVAGDPRPGELSCAPLPLAAFRP